MKEKNPYAQMYKLPTHEYLNIVLANYTLK